MRQLEHDVLDTLVDDRLTPGTRISRIASIYHHLRGESSPPLLNSIYTSLIDLTHGTNERMELRPDNQPLINRVRNQLLDRTELSLLVLGEPSRIARFLNALVLDGRMTDKIMDMAERHINSLAGGISLKNKIIFLEAFAHFNRPNHTLVRSIEQNLHSPAANFISPAQIISVMHSLAVLDRPRVAAIWESEKLQEIVLKGQIQYFDLIRLSTVSSLVKLKLPEDVLTAMHSALAEKAARSPVPTRFEIEVGEALSLLKIRALSGELVGGFFADYVLQLQDVPCVLECDGDRFHFVNGDINRGFVGGDILKNEVLVKAGYKVLHLAFSRWVNLPADRKAERLRDSLRQAVMQSDSSVKILL